MRKLLLAFVLLLLAGCAAPEAEPPPPATVQQIDRARITALEVELKQHQETVDAQIQVEAAGSKITLRGTVPSEEARRVALEAARKVEGVTEVDDQLTVAAP